MEDWMAEDLAARFSIEFNLARRLIRGMYILPILDSLDEVTESEEGDERAAEMFAQINLFVATKVSARVIVSCRNSGTMYQRATKRLRGFDEIKIKQLNRAKILEYIDSHRMEDASRAWDDIVPDIRRSDSTLALALATPWRLAMVTAYVNSGGDGAGLIPAKKGLPPGETWSFPIYLRSLDRLLYAAFIANKSRHYGRDPRQVLKALRTLAQIVAEDKDERHDGVVLPTWWKTLNERKIKRIQIFLVWFLAHVPGITLNFIHLPEQHFTAPPLIRAGTFVCSYLMLYVMAYDAIGRRTEPRAFTVDALKLRRGRVALAGAVLISIIMTYGSYLVLGITFAMMFSVACVMGSVATVFALPWDRATTRAPLSALTGDLISSIMLAIAVSTFMALNVYGVLGKAFGVFFFIGFFLCLAGTSVAVKYLIALIYGSYRYGLPVRFVHFLRWGHSAGLLRLSGITYQFRHEDFRKFLLAA